MPLITDLPLSFFFELCAYSYFVFLFRYISYFKAYPEAIGIIEYRTILEHSVYITVRHVIITSRKFNDCPKFIG